MFGYYFRQESQNLGKSIIIIYIFCRLLKWESREYIKKQQRERRKDDELMSLENSKKKEREFFDETFCVSTSQAKSGKTIWLNLLFFTHTHFLSCCFSSSFFLYYSLGSNYYYY